MHTTNQLGIPARLGTNFSFFTFFTYESILFFFIRNGRNYYLHIYKGQPRRPSLEKRKSNMNNEITMQVFLCKI
jgi:hypothetical protein